MPATPHLTRLDTAFSRDGEDKIYVQDLMLQHADDFWAWLQEGAFLYVCGDAFRMAEDVDKTLRRIAEATGGLSEDCASQYIQGLKDDHRYQRDVCA
jgi:sulfite reductase (NADPH) flavoprotein alpha-component